MLRNDTLGGRRPHRRRCIPTGRVLRTILDTPDRFGARQYLAERAFLRGANCTSVDAFMIGRTADGGRRAFLIEWKYAETYPREDKYIPERARVYDHLIAAEDSQFKQIPQRAFYYEPFYQLMRQTLLGWQISKHRDHGCTSYRHVHVVPKQNTEFHSNVISPLLPVPACPKRGWRYCGVRISTSARRRPPSCDRWPRDGTQRL